MQSFTFLKTFFSVNIEAPYEVLDTDYSNYAVVYSCNNLGLVHTSKHKINF